ncbi:hypothetical protein Tco_0816373 [Tanacetum coccineum]
MKIVLAVALSSQFESYASMWSALKFVVAFLGLDEVRSWLFGLDDVLGLESVDMVDKLQMVELDTVSAESCMREVGYSLIVVDESVDVNWQSKKYFDSFDVTVIT